MSDQTVTADNITIREIRGLQSEAYEHGDYTMVDICALALAPFESANHDGTPLIGIYGERTTRTWAREMCAQAINRNLDMGDD